MQRIVAASPLIKEPMTIASQVVLLEYDGGAKYSTHVKQDNGSIAHGNYFHGSDAFARAYVDWLKRCQEQAERFVEGNTHRPGQFFLFADRFIVEETKGRYIVRDLNVNRRQCPTGLAAGPFNEYETAARAAASLNSDPAWRKD